MRALGWWLACVQWYVRSMPQSMNHFSKLTRHQEISATPRNSYHCVWCAREPRGRKCMSRGVLVERASFCGSALNILAALVLFGGGERAQAVCLLTRRRSIGACDWCARGDGIGGQARMR